MGMVGDTCYPVLNSKENAWGKVASNVPDPPKCIEKCRTRFLERVVQGFDETRFSEVCTVLVNGGEAKKMLWELYCCDSISCGVYLSGKPDLGQDPSVNLIINTCQNIGSASVQDPGPPPVGYSCQAITITDDPESIPCQRPFLMTDPRGPLDPTKTGLPTMPTPPVRSFSTSVSTMTTSTRAASSALETSDASNSSQSFEQRHNGMPTSIKIAIGASSTVAFLAILAFVVFLFCRRPRHGYAQSIKSETKHHALPQANSPTPLISPAASTHEAVHTPLTPPPRLQERRLLPALLGPERPSIDVSIPGTPLGASVAQAGIFSQSPIASPTASKLAPRNDRSPRVYGVPPPRISTGAAQPRKTASVGSAASGRTVTAAFNVPGHPTSPTRPPRPHEIPLRIPDLVCPGPPPNRALPPAPPLSPVSLSPLFRQQHGSGGGSIGVAVSNGWVPPRNPARGVVLGKESRDLCDLTESCAKESRERDSWGSWGVGGGGTGVGASSVQRGSGRVNSPVLEEADLERMGGRY